MTDATVTERELRAALASLVPADLDASDFRTRLDERIAGGPATTSAVVELAPARRARVARAPRAVLVATIAACVAAVAATVVALLPGQGGHRPAPVNGPGVPAAVRAQLLPGTIVLGTYAGRGSRTYVVPRHAVPAHFGYFAFSTCSGGGDLSIAQQTFLDGCRSRTQVLGTSGAVTRGRLVITAAATTRWRITLTLAPDLRTNGSVQAPVDDDMAGPDNAVRHSGRGTQRVTLRGGADTPPPGTTYRVRLVCHGTGVALPALSGTRAHGLSTATCFAGREYVWTGVRLTLPATVRVVASPTTTWTVAVDAM